MTSQEQQGTWFGLEQAEVAVGKKAGRQTTAKSSVSSTFPCQPWLLSHTFSYRCVDSIERWQYPQLWCQFIHFIEISSTWYKQVADYIHTRARMESPFHRGLCTSRATLCEFYDVLYTHLLNVSSQVPVRAGLGFSLVAVLCMTS